MAKISVVIATYNGAKYIRQQLDSILNQTRQVDEIIISDNSSTDDTLHIVNEYAVSNSCISVYDCIGGGG